MKLASEVVEENPQVEETFRKNMTQSQENACRVQISDALHAHFRSVDEDFFEEVEENHRYRVTLVPAGRASSN